MFVSPSLFFFYRMTGSGRPGATQQRPQRYNVSPVTQPASDEWSVRTDGSDCLKPVPRVNHHQSAGQRPSLGVPCVPLQLTLIQWLIKCNHLPPCRPRLRTRPVPSPLHTFPLSDHNRTIRTYQLNCWIIKKIYFGFVTLENGSFHQVETLLYHNSDKIRITPYTFLWKSSAVKNYKTKEKLLRRSQRS